MNEATQPWHKQFWPWFLIILPSIAVVASLTSVGIAVVNRDSLVRDNYYKDGLAINTELEQDKTAMARGIAVDGAVDHLTISLKLAGAFTRQPKMLTMQFMHPLIDTKDFSIELPLNGQGQYAGTLPRALSGRWHVEIGAPDDVHWRLRQLIDLTDSPNFHIAQ